MCVPPSTGPALAEELKVISDPLVCLAGTCLTFATPLARWHWCSCATRRDEAKLRNVLHLHADIACFWSSGLRVVFGSLGFTDAFMSGICTETHSLIALGLVASASLFAILKFQDTGIGAAGRRGFPRSIALHE